MASTQTSIKHLSNEHNDWLRGLGFYKEELQILKGRLTEIASKNTGSDAMVMANHFENQIALQTTNIDVLRHNINTNLDKIAAQAQLNSAGFIDQTLADEHNKLREEYYAQEKVLTELRYQFNRFAAKWM